MKHVILLVAALAGAAGLRADDPNSGEPKSGYSITSDFTYASKYVFRGVENAKESFQPSVEFASGGFNAGVWTNQPLMNHTNNEVDFYTGYTYNVNTALKFEGVATCYWYPEANRAIGQTKDSYEAGVGATYNVGGFSPNLYYYHDFRLDSDTLQAAVGYSVPLAERLSVTTSLFAAATNARDLAPDAAGPRTRDSYTYWGADVTLPYKLSPHATLTAGVHYADTRGLAAPTNLLGDHNVWYTAGVSIGF